MRFGQFAEDWMATQPWRPSSRDRQVSVYRRHIGPAFGHRPIGTLRPPELQAWAAGLDLAPSTVGDVVGLLQAILNAAVTDGLLVQSPAGSIKLPGKESVPLVPLALDEVRALADAAPPHLRAAVILAAATGLRQGELFGLTGDRIIWLKRQLDIRQQLVTPSKGKPELGPPKNARCVRSVPVADHALHTLSVHLQQHGLSSQGFVFHHGSGIPWRRNRAAAAFDRMRTEAGVEASGWHSLRHHAASVLIGGGLGVMAVARMLGHTPEECLRIYAHWWPNEDEQIRSAVARAWQRGTGNGPIPGTATKEAGSERARATDL